MSLPAWVEEYRGKPFRRDADGPDAFDCYGLVRAVLRERWGAETPALDERWHADAAAALGMALDAPDCPWADADGDPLPGDVLTFAVPEQRELHVGIVVAPGWFLHARLDEGVRTERLDRLPWAALRFGPAYRHRALGGAA